MQHTDGFDLALLVIAQMLLDGARFGADALKGLSRPLASSWFRDPWSRGGYSAARPGHAGARANLAVPVEDRLFFCGEAASPKYSATCHGAYLTGIAAGKSAAKALAKSR